MKKPNNETNKSSITLPGSLPMFSSQSSELESFGWARKKVFVPSSEAQVFIFSSETPKILFYWVVY